VIRFNLTRHWTRWRAPPLRGAWFSPFPLFAILAWEVAHASFDAILCLLNNRFSWIYIFYGHSLSCAKRVCLFLFPYHWTVTYIYIYRPWKNQHEKISQTLISGPLPHRWAVRNHSSPIRHEATHNATLSHNITLLLEEERATERVIKKGQTNVYLFRVCS
jgi:hypothetical protein